MSDLEWIPVIDLHLAKGYEVHDDEGPQLVLERVKVAFDSGFVHIDTNTGTEDKRLIYVRPAAAVQSIAYEADADAVTPWAAYE